MSNEKHINDQICGRKVLVEVFKEIDNEKCENCYYLIDDKNDGEHCEKMTCHPPIEHPYSTEGEPWCVDFRWNDTWDRKLNRRIAGIMNINRMIDGGDI